jgi:hypothetical protein
MLLARMLFVGAWMLFLPLTASSLHAQQPTPPSPQLSNALKLLDAARADDTLIVRISAVDALARLAERARMGDTALTIPLFKGLEDLFLNYPQPKQKIYGDKVYFQIHLVQAFAMLGGAANNIVPNLVKAKGDCEQLNHEIDVAVGAILDDYTASTGAAPRRLSTTQSGVDFPAGGDSVESGAQTTLSIAVKDTTGKPIPGIQNDSFEVTLTGRGTSSGTFGSVVETPPASGTYTLAFNGTTAGSPNSVRVRINGFLLAKTPSITVSPGAPNESTSRAYFASATVISGRTNQLTIEVRDKAGNLKTGLITGNFTFSTQDAVVKEGDVKDSLANPGIYVVPFRAKSTTNGPITLTVAVLGKTLNDKPAVTVFPGDIDGAKTTITAPNSFVSGDETPVIFAVKDAIGNPVPSLGASSFKLEPEVGSGTSTLKNTLGTLVEEQAAGTYKVTFVGDKAGTTNTKFVGYVATIPVNARVEFKVTPGKASKTTSKVEFENPTVKAGKTIKMKIVLRDEANNPITGKTAAQVTFDPTGTVAKLAAGTVPGEYTAVFTAPAAAGEVTLKSKVDNEDLLETKIVVIP